MPINDSLYFFLWVKIAAGKILGSKTTNLENLETAEISFTLRQKPNRLVPVFREEIGSRKLVKTTL